jgi:hypothetical protein
MTLQNLNLRQIVRKYGIVLVLILMIILLSIVQPAFLSATNI